MQSINATSALIGGNNASGTTTGIYVYGSSGLVFDGSVPFDINNGLSANNVGGTGTAFRFDYGQNNTVRAYDLTTTNEAIYILYSSNLTIENVHIAGAATAGKSGIWFAGSNLQIKRSTVTGRTRCFSLIEGSASVVNSTFSGCSEHGVSAGSNTTLAINSSILWPTSPVTIAGGTTVSVIYSDLAVALPVGVTGHDNISADPLFVAAPADLSLGAGSPARDTGDPAIPPIAPDATGRIDMGAYEGVPTEPAPQLLLAFESLPIADTSSAPDTVSNDVAGSPVGLVSGCTPGSAGNFGGAAHLTVPASASWDFGGGDFTIEMWIKPEVAGKRILGAWYDVDQPNRRQWAIQTTSGGLFQAVYTLADGTVRAPTAQAADLGVWQHIALVRQGGNVTFFKNGVGQLIDSGVTQAFEPYPNDPLFIGWLGPADGLSRFFVGAIDDLRIDKGIARYSASFTPSGADTCLDQCPSDPNKTAPGACGCGYLDTVPCSLAVTVENVDAAGNAVTSFAYDSTGTSSGLGMGVYLTSWQPSPYATTFAVGTGERTFYGNYLGVTVSKNVDVGQLAPTVMATVNLATGTVTYESSTMGARVRLVWETFQVTVENVDTAGNPVTSFAYDSSGATSGLGMGVYVSHPLGDSGWKSSGYWTTFARGTGPRAFYGNYLGLQRVGSVDTNQLWPDRMATVNAATGAVTYGPSTTGARVRLVWEPFQVAVENVDTAGNPVTSFAYDSTGALSGLGMGVYVSHPLGDSGWKSSGYWTTFARATGSRQFYGNYLGLQRVGSVDTNELWPDRMATVSLATGAVTYGPSTTGARVRLVWELVPVIVENVDTAGNPVGTGRVYVLHPLAASDFQPSPFSTTFARGTSVVSFFATDPYPGGTQRLANVDVAQLGPAVRAVYDVTSGNLTYSPSTTGARVQFVYPIADECPNDPNKTAPGVCGCGVADADTDGDGVLDCNEVNECATDNGGCDPLTTCTDLPVGYTCGPCPPGLEGDGATGCLVPDDCTPVTPICGATGAGGRVLWGVLEQEGGGLRAFRCVVVAAGAEPVCDTLAGTDVLETYEPMCTVVQ